MIDLSFMEIVREYGLGTALGVILIPWVYTVDKRSREKNCPVPVGFIEDVKTRLDRVEASEHEHEAMQRVLDSKLDEMSKDLKSVLHYLQQKGLDK
jgi:hypothetical protein